MPRCVNQMDSDIIKALMAVDVAEVYSPPRVTAEAIRMKLKAGEAMDITTGWDFNLEEIRRKAEEYIDEEKTLLLIGSPMYTAFRQLQRLNGRKGHAPAKMKEAVSHMNL